MTAIVSIGLISCEKKNPPTPVQQPQCDCYKYEQEWLDGLGWANVSYSDTTEMNCNIENQDWTYTNAQQTKRYKYNCL